MSKFATTTDVGFT